MLWTILGNTGTLVTIETGVKEAVQKIKDIRNQKHLQFVDEKFKLQELSNIEEAYLEENLDEYIARHAEYFKEDELNRIFSEKEKKEFVNIFLERNRDLIIYRDIVTDILNMYINKIEKYISKVFTEGERIIYKHLKDQDDKLDTIEQYLINQNQSEKKTNHIYTANSLYADSFANSLFLHKNASNTKVNLKNLFVIQKYRTISWDKIGDVEKDLAEYLSNFINNDNETAFLFVEGDAGCGKSSLVSYLSYHYENNGDLKKKVFGEKHLLTIRLRDIKAEKIRESGELIQGILDYLQIKSLAELENEYQNAVILLDGFDELCIIESLTSNAEHFLYDLMALENYKMIITTRPKYIRIQQLDIRKKHIILQHFDCQQRNEWLDKYINDCGETVDDHIKCYIERITDEDAFGICDTPMALYMIVGGKIENYALYNEWVLYHQIFYKELSQTEYNKLFPNENRKYSHEIFKYRDIIYRISEEIAYKMYCMGNSRLYLSDEELKKIVEGFGIQDIKTKELAERCYALCSYWKTNSERGIVEFYHNNIRDFFLCEKIFREINEDYQQWKENTDKSNKEIIEKFCSLFQYGHLETMVSKFILLRTLNSKREGQGIDFPKIEKDVKRLPDIFEYMLTQNSLYTYYGKNNSIQTIINILSCVIQIYRHIYEPYLKEGEVIAWWNNIEAINKNGLLKFLFQYIFIKVPLTLQYGDCLTLASKADFSDVDLQSCDLRNVGFNFSVMRNVSLSNTILCGADFSNADLYNADLTNADMHYSCLSNAKLEKCNMTGVDLRGTDLPDEYCSDVQEEQLEHLRGLNIKDIII